MKENTEIKVVKKKIIMVNYIHFLYEMTQTKVKIIRSAKRKRTIQAKMIQDTLWIYFPMGMAKAKEEKWIKEMTKRFAKQKHQQQLNKDGTLQIRAQQINKQYFNGELDFTIKYVANQTSKFGSCTPRTKMIRVSDRIASMPRWVQDYVIIHELAHLIHPNHSKKFWETVYQYKYTERAKGYLIAVGLTSDEKI